MKSFYRVVNEEERNSYEKVNWKSYDYSGDDCVETESLTLAVLFYKGLTDFEKKYFIIEKVDDNGRETIYKKGEYFKYDKKCFLRGQNIGHDVVQSPAQNRRVGKDK